MRPADTRLGHGPFNVQHNLIIEHSVMYFVWYGRDLRGCPEGYFLFIYNPSGISLRAGQMHGERYNATQGIVGMKKEGSRVWVSQ